MSTEQSLLELKGVTKAYGGPHGPRTEVLSGIDLDVGDGASVAIVGPSGSGKSTLLNIMGSLDTPTEGTVTLGGQDLSALDERSLARLRNTGIGFVFQLHHLLPQCTLLENVLMPALPAGDLEGADVRARALLERVGLAHRLGHRPGQLSGGECQRAAVVRALINRPRVLFADEPTGSLDRAGSDALGALLAELNSEERVTLVVVTHSEALAARMGQEYLLSGGRLLAREGRG